MQNGKFNYKEQHSRCCCSKRWQGFFHQFPHSGSLQPEIDLKGSFSEFKLATFPRELFSSDGILECKKDSLRTYVVNLKHECKSNKLSVEHLTSIQEEADVYASTSLEKSNIRQYPQPWHRCNGAGTWKIASLWMALWQAPLNSTVSSIWLTRRSTCGIPRIPCITWKWSNGYHIMWKVQSLVLEYLKENA